MLPAHIAVCIYIMTGKADVSTASRAAASGEESVETRAPARNPVLSPSSDSADTTEAAVEEPSVPASPSPADTAPAVSAAVSAESDAGSVSGSPPPEAWGAIMSFLDRPQEARQSALASLPTSDLIRLTLEASATALGRLGWYEGTSVSVSGNPIRNPLSRSLRPSHGFRPLPRRRRRSRMKTRMPLRFRRLIPRVRQPWLSKVCPIPLPGGSWICPVRWRSGPGSPWILQRSCTRPCHPPDHSPRLASRMLRLRPPVPPRRSSPMILTILCAPLTSPWTIHRPEWWPTGGLFRTCSV